MSDTRPVPTNLDGWPGVTDLVVTYKHILHVLWSSPSGLVSVIGVGRPGVIEHLTGATRLDEPVVLEALRELQRRGLVVLDENTREVAIRRWCRFHKFPGRWATQARYAYEKIESAVIRSVLVKQEGVNSIFPEKSKLDAPNSNNIVNINAAEAALTPKKAASAPSAKACKYHPSGIECWTATDISTANKIAADYSSAEILEAIAAASDAGKTAVPGTIKSYLHAARKKRTATLANEARAAQILAQDAALELPQPTFADIEKLPAGIRDFLSARIKYSKPIKNEKVIP